MSPLKARAILVPGGRKRPLLMAPEQVTAAQKDQGQQDPAKSAATIPGLPERFHLACPGAPSASLQPSRRFSRHAV